MSEIPQPPGPYRVPVEEAMKLWRQVYVATIENQYSGDTAWGNANRAVEHLGERFNGTTSDD